RHSAPQATAPGPAGSVISSSPSAGTQVNVGSAVNLVVSSGSGTTAPPPSVAKVVFSDGAGVRTTAAFNTSSANELLLAYVSAAGPLTLSQKQTSLLTGPGLHLQRNP